MSSYSVSCSSSVTHPIQLHQELPPLRVPHSREDLQSHRSASSLTSLPLTSLASTSSLSLTSDPLSAQLSPEAMLAEIAQLSRQNELIKAQLSQAKGRGSGVGGSPNSSNGQKRLSSSSAGRVTPENVGERRPSVSSSTGRKSQHVPSAEGEQLTNQVYILWDCIISFLFVKDGPAPTTLIHPKQTRLFDRSQDLFLSLSSRSGTVTKHLQCEQRGTAPAGAKQTKCCSEGSTAGAHRPTETKCFGQSFSL